MKYEVLFLSLVIVSILGLLIPIDSVYANNHQKPGKPTDVTSVLTSKTTARVSWVAPTDDGGSPIIGYQVERKIASSTTWVIIEDDTGNTNTSFDDPEVLIKNATYDYRVRGINSNGIGQPAKNNSVTAQSGSSQAGFDTKAPSFTKLFSENEYPLTIHDKSFTVSQLSGKVETTKVYIDKPVQIKLRAYENKGPSNVWEVLLHTNLHGVQRELYQSDTYVLYKQNNPLQVIDPNGFFSDVKVSTSTVGKFEIIFDITFAKEMEKSDIIFQVRDRSGNSVMLTVHDAWEIVENSDETSVLFGVSMDKDPIVSVPETKTEQKQETSLETEPVIKKPIKKQIPSFVKNSAGWWSDKLITDNDFLKGIQYLIQQSFIIVPDTAQIQEQSRQIPDWVRNVAGWWSDDLIGENEFVNGIEWLLSNGILRL